MIKNYMERKIDFKKMIEYYKQICKTMHPAIKAGIVIKVDDICSGDNIFNTKTDDLIKLLFLYVIICGNNYNLNNAHIIHTELKCRNVHFVLTNEV